MDFGRNGGLAMAIEQCNGQALCRKDDGVMCPSFQATREEMHSTRGRANLLRALISTGFPNPRSAVVGSTARRVEEVEHRKAMSDAVFEALDLCLGCKGCKGECPSGVDMAKLKSTFLEEYYQGRWRSARDYAFGYFHTTARILSMLAPIANAMNRIPSFHRVISRAIAIAPERPLPNFAHRLAKPHRQAGLKPLFMLRDPFTHYVDSEVEQAAFDLLMRAGFEVQVLRAMGAGASMVSKGFLKAARRHAEGLMTELAGKDPRGSTPLVAIEPSELSTLRNDYADLLPDRGGATLKQVTGARGVDQLLFESSPFSEMRVAINSQQILFHPHCHERTHERSTSSFASLGLLRSVGYQVQLMDEGCCGMAGTFGYEAEHYELSQKIAALRLLPRIKESSGAGVAATGAACRMQIAQSTNAEVAHPLVWVKRALNSG
jgi:Fe-S oxidoreductase